MGSNKGQSSDDAADASGLHLCEAQGLIHSAWGRFDPATRLWDGPSSVRGEACDHGSTTRPVSLEDAVHWLQTKSGHPLRPPIAVIGARDASPDALALAETVGMDLAHIGLVLLTGGKGGVMEAACRGAITSGGLTLGLLPDDHWDGANAHVAIPLASGLGVARNAIIARAAFALIAVAGGYGTLSEMALALQFGRPVFTLPGAPQVEGARAFTGWDKAREALCRAILGL